MPARLLGVCLFVVWVIAVGTGVRFLRAYQNTPGPAAAAPATWPVASSIPSPGDRPALILALHPQCPYSAATVAELSRLLARTAGRADVYAVFVVPRDADRPGSSPRRGVRRPPLPASA